MERYHNEQREEGKGIQREGGSEWGQRWSIFSQNKYDWSQLYVQLYYDAGGKDIFEKCNYVLVIGKQYKCTRVCQPVSGLPETVVETVVLTQEDSLKKNSGQKKKNRERGKVKLPWTS